MDSNDNQFIRQDAVDVINSGELTILNHPNNVKKGLFSGKNENKIITVVTPVYNV